MIKLYLARHGETEGNVFVGIGAAITSGLADYTYGTSRFNPALG
mgnify:CR=1 FL=1